MAWRIVESGLLVIARIGVAGVLGYAGWTKLESQASLKEFARAIDAYKILPDHLVIVSAHAFPWIELIAAVLLVLGIWTRAAGVVASLLMAGFLGAIISVMVRESVVVTECGCFAKAGFLCSGPPGWCHIGQDSVLLMLSLFAAIRGGGAASLDRAFDPRSAGVPVTGAAASPQA